MTQVARKHLLLEDLEALLPPKQAQEAFALVDKNGDGRLTLQEMAGSIANILRRAHAWHRLLWKHCSDCAPRAPDLDSMMP